MTWAPSWKTTLGRESSFLLMLGFNELTQDRHNPRCLCVRRSQPDVHSLYFLVDLVHNDSLTDALCVVKLVDANDIYPVVSSTVDVSQVHERTRQILGNRVVLTAHSMVQIGGGAIFGYAFGGSPGIR